MPSPVPAVPEANRLEAAILDCSARPALPNEGSRAFSFGPQRHYRLARQLAPEQPGSLGGNG